MPPSIKVLVTGPLPGDAEKVLSDFAQTKFWRSSQVLKGQEFIDQLVGCNAVVCQLSGPVTAEVMDRSPNLKLISNVAVGYDNIDVEHASKRGILVLNTPGVLDEATADIAFALLISVARRVVEADSYLRAGKWKGFGLELMLGKDLHSKTIGIVGLGRIGQAMARRCLGFGMNVIYSQRNRAAAEIEQQLGAKHVSLDQLLSTSDFVSLHCPMTPETRHLISTKQLAIMKPGSILVNAARGPIVDEKALIASLKSGHLFGAGLDVYENEPAVSPELVDMDNVVLLPHIGSATRETREAMANLAVTSLIEALSGKQPSNIVNKNVWNRFCQSVR